MKPLRILGALVACAAFASTARAQMSTFPAPPPLPSAPSAPATLAPPSDSAAPARSSAAPATAPALTAATLNSMEALDNKTALADGDTISFRVIEDRDDPVQRVVTDTGAVDFPYIGPVTVEGKTCHEVALDVKKRLEVDYYKQATVIIGLDRIVGQDNDTKPKDFAWVMGEVRSVGPVELLKQQPMTVSQVIMRAGGPGDFADQRKVKVVHRADGTAPNAAELNNSKDYQVVDVKAIFDGQSVADPVVKPGDYIIVPKKIFNY
ncbi:MAG TPA: polysaccharide biosynthesis/export family protein [Candidatus Methylacidiphilales bacterium]|jgi:polysaccharide export outer membrane protein|nr:polysaccharide biosynthesis/export family protein [Candidatus Methylacidiphilales bacterium]